MGVESAAPPGLGRVSASDSVGTAEAAGRRQAVLAALRSADDALAVPQLAELLNVHPNTIRFHLETLIARGQVERLAARTARPGRPRSLYRALAVMDPHGPRHYRTLAAVLVGELAATPDGPARATDAGRAWGARLDPAAVSLPQQEASAQATGRLVALLDDFGFDPRPAGGTDVAVELWHCPFLELAESAPEVVCGAHLGIMQGALAAWRAPITVERLDPWTEPGCCVARLGPTQPRS